MAFLIVIVLGIAGFRFLPVDLLPPIEFPQLTIAVNYPNVGPEEIEQIIVQPLENAIAGVPGVKRVRSQASEGRGRVTLEFTQGTNLDEAANDVRAALDRLRSAFPEEADAPRIYKFDPNNFPVVIIGASSEMPLPKLTEVLERDITKRFEQIPGVGSIDIWGAIHKQVQVNLKRDRLIASGLSSQQVQQAIVNENTNLPGGNVNEGIKNLYVRTKGEFNSVEEIQQTVITTIDAQPIKVQDVAEVYMGYEDLSRLVKIDGKPMLRFGIRKQSGTNTVEVADLIIQQMDLINAERDDLNLFVTTDQSLFIQDSIDSVKNSALWGALFAIIILYAFLRNGSSTMIVAIAIPISIIATFSVLYFAGLTLNQMSFGGLALGVGLIVDNAIVVLENIVQLREKGNSKEESALIGTKQVTGAIIASTLTTIVIFIPVIFMQTITGMLYQELALVVVFSLLCSLLVALTIVPMLASKFLTATAETNAKAALTPWGKFLGKTDEIYAKILAKAIHNKKWVILTTAILLTTSVLLFPTIPVEMAPQADADEIDIDLQMAEGTNIAVLNEYLKELEYIVRKTVPMQDVKHLTTDVRDGNAEVEITMVSADKRSKSTSQLADEIREQLAGVIPGADIRVTAQSGLWILRRVFGSGGNDAIEVELRGYNLEKAKELAQALKLEIETVKGVEGVRVGIREGRPEENYIFNREKISALGLSVRDVAQVIQTNVGGSRAGAYRQEGQEYPIIVRLRAEDRLSAQDLSNISIRTPNGMVVPVGSLVDKVQGRGPTGITRVNSQRVTFVTANLQSGVALSEAVGRIQNQIKDVPVPDGFSVVFGGEFQQQEEAASDFNLTIIMALLLIYMVMAGQFERFIDPLIVMFSVPLALIGVVPALLLTGTTINIQSLMGLIMLVGIVVNNAIVLVDYINLLRRDEGLDVLHAVIEAGKLRLRPILMTTLTTVLGLLPMAMGIGPGAEIQASLARVVIGGLTASTLVSLILIPTIYLIVDGLRTRYSTKKAA